MIPEQKEKLIENFRKALSQRYKEMKMSEEQKVILGLPVYRQSIIAAPVSQAVVKNHAEQRARKERLSARMHEIALQRAEERARCSKMAVMGLPSRTEKN